MSREEAIKKIKQFGLYHAIDDLPKSTNTVEAFNMAIEALEQEPCEDCISRQAVLDLLYNHNIVAIDIGNLYIKDTAEINVKELKDLPSVEPTRKKGEWIHGREIRGRYIDDMLIQFDHEDWRCSKCKIVFEQSRKPTYKFCPNCGAEMAESEDKECI